MDEPILTAIIITYNQKDTISECIESVLNQKTKYNYVIHICDDASTDGTSDIIREYEKKYPNIIKSFIQEKNTLKNDLHKNQSYLALKRITTKYWTIIEGDDYWSDENKIEICVKALEENPECKMAAHNTLWLDTVNNDNHLTVPEDIKEGIFNFYNKFYTHTSARVHTTIPEMLDNDLIGDSYFYYYYSAIAPYYYCDKVMSVYRFNGKGVWSRLTKKKQKALNRLIAFRMCQFTNFEYEDKWFSLLNTSNINMIKFFKIFGKKAGWYIWAIIRFVPLFGFCVLSRKWSYLQCLK